MSRKNLKPMTVSQLLWLYVRAWWWAHVPEAPRFGAALWGWLGLGATCALSLRFSAEVWPHTPAASSWAAAGLALAGAVSLGLVLRGLWRWLGVIVRHHHGWGRLVLVGLLCAAGVLLLAGLALAAAFGLATFLVSRLDWSGFRG